MAVSRLDKNNRYPDQNCEEVDFETGSFILSGELATLEFLYIGTQQSKFFIFPNLTGEFRYGIHNEDRRA
jgi:hypothetical protein